MISFGRRPSESIHKTASCNAGPARRHYRNGDLRLARFTLPADAFQTWPDMIKQCNEWTPEHVTRLEDSAAKLGQRDTSTWRCRKEPLSLDLVLKVETRSYTSGWSETELTRRLLMRFSDNAEAMGFIINREFFSQVAFGTGMTFGVTRSSRQFPSTLRTAASSSGGPHNRHGVSDKLIVSIHSRGGRSSQRRQDGRQSLCHRPRSPPVCSQRRGQGSHDRSRQDQEVVQTSKPGLRDGAMLDRHGVPGPYSPFAEAQRPVRYAG